MHSVLEGVVKGLFSRWFGQENYQLECSLRANMQQIDSRIISLKPPKFVPTTPRSIYTWKQWRAHEYLSFIMYYSLPVLVDIMEASHFEHHIKFVLFLEIILSREIAQTDLEFAQSVIIEYVKEFSEIYTPASMLSGVHELLHLVECTQNYGPLNNINCFPFEELNRKVIGSIHGRDLMGEEFIKMLSLIQSLSATVGNLQSNSKYSDFIKKEMNFKTSNRKRLAKAANNEDVKILSKGELLKEVSINEAIKKETGIELDEILVFTKIDYNGILYTSSKIDTKNCDSCFTTADGIFGNVEFFFTCKKKFYVYAKKIIRLYNPFFWEKFPNRKASIYYCYCSNNIIIEEVCNIRKCALIFFEEKFFVSTFTSSHLFN